MDPPVDDVPIELREAARLERLHLNAPRRDGPRVVEDLAEIEVHRCARAARRLRGHDGRGSEIVAEVPVRAPLVRRACDWPPIVNDARLQALAPCVAAARLLRCPGQIGRNSRPAHLGAVRRRCWRWRHLVGLHAVARALAHADLALGQLRIVQWCDGSRAPSLGLGLLALRRAHLAHPREQIDPHDRRLSGARRRLRVICEPEGYDRRRPPATREVQTERRVGLNHCEDANGTERLAALVAALCELHHGHRYGLRHPIAALRSEVRPVLSAPLGGRAQLRHHERRHEVPLERRCHMVRLGVEDRCPSHETREAAHRSLDRAHVVRRRVGGDWLGGCRENCSDG
mmetsp:Transcript_104413/g.319739  ORF Transcript_104413/g.319739 Transcript_104413/m.319739 type:complete len:344 (+) Transcript_104413:848-1879(+)